MSVKVILIKDKPIGQYVIDSVVTSIGRKSECDISIKDPAVSGTHAQIKKAGENYIIEDLGSTNGVVLRGRKVKQQTLKHNDVVTIGEHHLKFLITEAIATKREPTSVPMGKKSEGSGLPGGQLEILTGADAGQKLALEEGLTTIGEPGIQVAAVSRRPQGHYIIHVDGGKDKDRVPLVNDEPTGFKSRKLEDGDKIEVAGIKMEYRVT